MSIAVVWRYDRGDPKILHELPPNGEIHPNERVRISYEGIANPLFTSLIKFTIVDSGGNLAWGPRRVTTLPFPSGNAWIDHVELPYTGDYTLIAEKEGFLGDTASTQFSVSEGASPPPKKEKTDFLGGALGNVRTLGTIALVGGGAIIITQLINAVRGR